MRSIETPMLLANRLSFFILAVLRLCAITALLFLISLSERAPYIQDADAVAPDEHLPGRGGLARPHRRGHRLAYADASVVFPDGRQEQDQASTN
jgi:hypothetical protein